METVKTEFNFEDLTGFWALPIQMSFVKMISLMPNSLSKIMKFVIDMLVLFFLFVAAFQNYSLFLGWKEAYNKKDFFRVSNSINYTIIFIDLLQKYTLMRFNTATIEYLGNWANNVKATRKNEPKLIKVAKFINKFHFVGSHFTAIFWSIYPVITGKKILPLKYPFLEDFLTTISFPIEFILYTGFSTVISYSTGVFLHTTTLFCSEIHRLADDWASLTYDMKQPHLYSQQIKLLVARHVKLLEISVYIKKLHEIAFGFQIILTMILIFTGVFGIIKLGDDAVVLILITTPFGILTGLEFYFMCWVGVDITDTFSSFREKLYFTNWIEASKNDQQSIWIIMEFTKKPVVLTGVKIYTASLHTFGKVMKETFSLYTVLKTIMV